MHLRRKFAIAVGAVVLSVPVLSSCGFDDATDAVYTPAAGANNRDFAVDVLNAVIVAAQPGRGTFVAGLSNAADEPVTLTSVSGDGVETTDFKPVEIAGDNGYVDLRTEDVHLTGDVVAGEVVAMSLEFDNGETVELNVPTVTSCDEFEGADTSGESADAGSETEDEEPYSCEVEHLEGGGH